MKSKFGEKMELDERRPGMHVRQLADGEDQEAANLCVFPEPQPLLTPAPKLPGTDGRKMSKSYGNSILLSDPEAEVRKKLKTMVTDPARVRRTDPGNPDLCPVGDLHKIFSSSGDHGRSAPRLHHRRHRMH